MCIGTITKIATLLDFQKGRIKTSLQLNTSECFDISLGLKQSEPLPRLLFILFLIDIAKCIDPNKMSNNDLEL